MQDLQKNDVIVAGEVKERVLARLEDLIFTQRIFANGSLGHVSGPQEISDLETFGFVKEG